MNLPDFRDAFLAGTRGAILHVLSAPNPEAREVGILAALPSADRYLLTPRVIWFPWASSRNRLECSLKWLTEARKTTMPVFHVDEALRGFFRHLCRYGVLREVGVEHHVPRPGRTSWRYQAVRLEG